MPVSIRTASSPPAKPADTAHPECAGRPDKHAWPQHVNLRVYGDIRERSIVRRGARRHANMGEAGRWMPGHGSGCPRRRRKISDDLAVVAAWAVQARLRDSSVRISPPGDRQVVRKSGPGSARQALAMDKAVILMQSCHGMEEVYSCLIDESIKVCYTCSPCYCTVFQQIDTQGCIPEARAREGRS